MATSPTVNGASAPAKLAGQLPPSTRKRQAAAEPTFSGPFVRTFATADAYIAGMTKAQLRAEMGGQPAGYVAAVEAAIERRTARKAAEKAAEK